MLTLLAALSLAAAPPEAPPPGAEPTLTPPQAAALRCGVVFAIGARMQADRNPAAASWPPLATRGKEYFVRLLAQLIDDTGASRDILATMAAREVPALKDAPAIAAAMPACLALLDDSGG